MELISSIPREQISLYSNPFCLLLWCTDAAKWAPHPHPTRRRASNATTYALVSCQSFFFFFFNMDLHRLNSNSHRFKPIPTKPSRFNQNRVLMGRIRSIGQRLKQAEIGLESCRNNRNRLWMRPKHPKSVIPQFYFEYLLLLLCFLFCFVFLAFFFLCFVNQWHIMCFLRIF